MNKRKISITVFLVIMTMAIIVVFTTILKNSGKNLKENYVETTNLISEENEVNTSKQTNIDFTKYKLEKLNDQNVLASINYCLNLYKRYSSNSENNDSIDNKKTLFSIIPDDIINNVGNNTNDYIIKSKDEFRIDKIYSAIQDIDNEFSGKTYTHYLSKDTTLYLLKITRYDSIENTMKNNTLGIVIDSYNGYFWIIPYKYFKKNNIKIENETGINLLAGNNSLKKNNINKLSNNIGNNEQNICKIYYDNFIFNVKYDIKKAYQDLDSKYKTNGYDETTYLNFLKQKNLDNGIILNSSMNITDDDKYLYQIVDEKNNIIDFTSDDVMEYKVAYENLSLS